MKNKTNKRKKTSWVLMGLVSVDSGTLMIGDSCYLCSDWTDKDYDRDVCSNWKFFKQLRGENGYLKAVVFHSGLGDGIYEVWGKIKKVGCFGKRVTEVKIKLI